MAFNEEKHLFSYVKIVCLHMYDTIKTYSLNTRYWAQLKSILICMKQRT